MSQVVTVSSYEAAGVRYAKFMAAFSAMPEDGDLEIQVGRDEVSGMPAIILGLGGLRFPFRLDEATVILETMDTVVARFPQRAKDEGFADLRDGVRLAVETARKHGLQ